MNRIGLKNLCCCDEERWIRPEDPSGYDRETKYRREVLTGTGIPLACSLDLVQTVTLTMAPDIHASLTLSFVSFGLGAALTWMMLRKRIGSSFRGPRTTTAIAHAPVKFVHPPQRSWIPGQPLHPPFDTVDNAKMVSVDPLEADKAYLYSLMISAVAPRPIGFITSMSKEGNVNLAPYSYFNMASRLSWTKSDPFHLTSFFMYDVISYWLIAIP